MFNNLSDRQRTVLQIGFVAALIIGAIVLVMVLGGSKPILGARNVSFRVDASGGVAFITLQAGSVSYPKLTTVTAPWVKNVQVARGTIVYFTASNPTQTGKLTCSIFLDNEEWKTESTDAPKDGVACAGIVP